MIALFFRARAGRNPRAAILLGVGTLVLSIPSGTRADLLLHEYIGPDPVEDLKLGATTSDGTMAAAIETRGGPVASPELDRSRQGASHVYGGEQGPGPGGSFRIDSNTSRPDRVSYEDPFTPTVTPYKREVAYDTVDASFDLAVANPALERLPVGGAGRPEDDQFYADLEVDAAPATFARIPTVGPGARVLALRSSPPATIAVLHDAADNWFVQSDRPGRLRLVLHLVIDRAVFGSSFASVDWARLAPLVRPIPDLVRGAGVDTARQIGIPDGASPGETLRALVTYFRGFAPSTDHPTARGQDLYRELVLSRKGVCRHRAYAFVVTALALGIPARFVRNEAHAWVEVTDGARFHRIDLGGAAADVELPSGRISHVPPRDPFEWPAGEDSGEAMAGRAARAREQESRQASSASSAGASAAPPSALPSQSGDDSTEEDGRPPSTLTLHLAGKDAARGSRIHASGEVSSRSGPCQAVRVDLVLEPAPGPGKPAPPPRAERIALGTLVTNGEGRYEGSVVVPFTIPPGDYDVRATTPGGSVCGKGESP